MKIEIRVELEAIKSFGKVYAADFKLYKTVRIVRRK